MLSHPALPAKADLSYWVGFLFDFIRFLGFYYRTNLIFSALKILLMNIKELKYFYMDISIGSQYV